MRKLIIIVYSLFILYFIGCSRSSRKPDFILEFNVEKTGNISDYEDLKIYYLDYNDTCLLPYALIMANKYKYNKAYYDVYWCIYSRNPISNDTFFSLDGLSPKDRTEALFYLKKGSDLGCLEAMEVLGKYYIYGKYFDKDTLLGNKLIKKSEERYAR
mgnify:FL=1